MEREDIEQAILKEKGRHVLVTLPTSFGKTRIALKRTARLTCYLTAPKILVLVPKLVIVNDWKNEMEKIGLQKLMPYVTFSTYKSIEKHVDTGWDVVIADECHHLSERCLYWMSRMKMVYVMMLSATVSMDKLLQLEGCFNQLRQYGVSTRKAIESNILPDPKVYLMPLVLNNTARTEMFYAGPSSRPVIECDYDGRFDILKKGYRAMVHCTQFEYNKELNNRITYLKGESRRNGTSYARNIWLRKSLDRLKWLTDKKMPYIIKILEKVSDKRTLTFCNSMAQAEMLGGENCVISSNENRYDVLDRFNKGEINHITTCGILDEGVNLVNCKMGIYAALSSSEIIVKQRLGRILRHPDPVIIIPYFDKTREEEMMMKMLTDYNPDKIKWMQKVATPEEI